MFNLLENENVGINYVRRKPFYSNIFFRLFAAMLILILPVFFVPQWYSSIGAKPFFNDERSSILPLAETVKTYAENEITKNDFNTGSNLFDGEWLFGSHMMTALGLLQTIKLFPDKKEIYLPVVEKCIQKILSEEDKHFDKNSWNEDPIESLGNGKDHAAYLGYLNLVLGYYRNIVANPKVELIELNDKISNALILNLEKREFGLLETYPDEYYPIDNATVITSIKLYSLVTGKDVSVLMNRVFAVWENRYIDKKSGLLYQSVNLESNNIGRPRASGTALAAYFFSFAYPEFSERLFQGLKKSCAKNWFGFGVINEYPEGDAQGSGDIDSGPVILGASFSGTGFTISSARIHGDYDLFLKLYRISTLVGSPISLSGRTNYVCGGPLGNSIMLAMLTAEKRVLKK